MERTVHMADKIIAWIIIIIMYIVGYIQDILNGLM